MNRFSRNRRLANIVRTFASLSFGILVIAFTMVVCISAPAATLVYSNSSADAKPGERYQTALVLVNETASDVPFDLYQGSGVGGHPVLVPANGSVRFYGWPHVGFGFKSVNVPAGLTAYTAVLDPLMTENRLSDVGAALPVGDDQLQVLDLESSATMKPYLLLSAPEGAGITVTWLRLGREVEKREYIMPPGDIFFASPLNGHEVVDRVVIRHGIQVGAQYPKGPLHVTALLTNLSTGHLIHSVARPVGK